MTTATLALCIIVAVAGAILVIVGAAPKPRCTDGVGFGRAS
ncbi:hypothetical protein LJR186_003915 [Microbacterium foliorum]